MSTEKTKLKDDDDDDDDALLSQVPNCAVSLHTTATVTIFFKKKVFEFQRFSPCVSPHPKN